jgi:hypothetical protein
MSDSESEPGDRAMLWFNVVGILIATALLGTFFTLYGGGLMAFIQTLLQPEPFMP